MQKLNAEIAALLRTIESQLLKEGFSHEGGSAVIKDRSDSLESPQLWTPLWMYRTFQHKKNKDDVIIVNVVLDNTDDAENFQEPVLLCGRFRYKKGKAKKYIADWYPWDLWFCRPMKKLDYVYSRKELKIESKEFLMEADWSEEAVRAMLEIRFLAVPLAALADSKSLQNSVVQRIV
jgi:hypothetical protein